MDRIEILRAFVGLVERGSFTAVADELRVKQSTISKWLLALEDELGAQLLDRTTRSRRVTDDGQRFYRHAVSILAAYDAAVSDLRQGDASHRGRIRVALPVVFGRMFVVPLVTRFLRQHRDIEIEMAFQDRYEGLVEEGHDLSIRVGIPVDSSLRSHSLGESARRLVASPGYLRAHGVPTTPKELEQHQCLVHSELHTPTLWTFTRDGRSLRANVRGRVSANNSEATLALCKSGLGICLLASWLLDSELRSGRLVQLLDDYEPPRAPIRALTPPGRHVPPRVRALIEHLRAGLDAALRD